MPSDPPDLSRPPSLAPARLEWPAQRAAHSSDVAPGDHAHPIEPSFRHFAESLSDLVWSARPDGYSDYYNTRFLDYVGYTRDELRGWTWAETLHPDDAEGARRAWERASATGGEYEVEFRIRRHDGQYRWHRSHGYPMLDDEGRIARWFGTCTDIEERKAAAERLRESEAALRAFFDNSPALAGVVEPTGDGDILHVFDSPTTCRFFGAAPGATAGRRAGELGASPENIARWLDAYRRSEASGGPVRFEYEHGGPGGTWLSVTVSPIGPGPDGRSRFCYVAEDVTERRRADERLRAGEAQLRAVYDQAAVGIAETDLSGRFLRANARFCEIVGYPPEELLGLRFQDITHPDDPHANLEKFARVADGPSTYTIEKRYVHKGGRAVRAQVAVSLIRDAEGRPERTVAVVEDITERVRAEEGLREGEERLRLALEAGRLGTWDWDLRTGALAWSENLEQVHGLPPGGFDGTIEGFRRLVHPEDRGQVEAAIRGSIEGVSGYEAEFRIVRPDGSVGWMLGKGKVFADRSGRAARMIGFGADITERKRAEERLRDSERRFARFMDHLPGLAWIKDARGIYIYANDAAERALGAPRSDLYGRSDEDVFPKEIAALYREHDRQALESGAGVQVIEPLQYADGTVHHSLVSKFPIPSPGGEELLVGGIAIDVTDRLAMEEALREADRRKGEFLATLAHELRNPLAPIRHAAALLAEHPAIAGEAGAEVEMIARQVAHLARLVDDLLDIARIERGKVVLRREPLELATVLRRAAEAARPALEEHGHRLTLTLPAGPLAVEADATRLEQVVGNLLGNAIKYTEPGGEIALGAWRDGDRAVIRVRDTGVGIPPEMLPRIFEPFVQVDGHARRSQGGLGIGLGLVKGLVQLHGGTVEAHSAGPGAGSEFVVRLPALPDEAPGRDRPDRRGRDSRDLPRHRVLVVDDNRDAAASLAKLLSRLYGQEVRVAHDGPEALAVAGEFLPEVVLLDIGMPGLDGYEVARRLRGRPEFRTTRIVALTGWGQESDRRKSAEAGFDRHMVKPVDPAELRAMLASETP